MVIGPEISARRVSVAAAPLPVIIEGTKYRNLTFKSGCICLRTPPVHLLQGIGIGERFVQLLNCFDQFTHQVILAIIVVVQPNTR